MDIENNIFFDEFNNKLIMLENGLIDIKNGQYDRENINEIFRSIHTIKSTADLLGMFDVVHLINRAEDLLQLVRENKIVMDQILCKFFMDMKEFISLIIGNISKGIFDDPSVEKLYIYFEKELNHLIGKIDKQDEHDEKTILIIDAAALVRYSFKRIALDAGYVVLTTQYIENGWDKIQDNPIDLIVCDFVEPNEKALDLAKMIQANFGTDNLPIVMMLSKIDEKTDQLKQLISATACLKKPLSEKEVLLVLKKIFG